MQLSRRDFMKTYAAVAAASVAVPSDRHDVAARYTE